MLKVAIFSASERVDICENLASRWGQRIEPVIWKYDVFAAGETAADAITRAAQSVDFAVCVMTADDELSSRGSSHWVPRDNVIMEYGLCAGALGTDRAILLVEDDPSLKLPTNSAGITQVRFSRENIVPAGIKLMHHFKKVGRKRQTHSPLIHRVVPGNRLFSYKGLYPIQLGKNDLPSMDYEIYGKALKFLVNDIDDQLAALDLAFLRFDNQGHIPDPVSTTELGSLFCELMEKYDLDLFFEEFTGNKQEIFSNFVRLTNELGDTLSGVNCEFVLHNVMNPLRSIIAVKNATEISKRTLHDPSTRFVVQFVKEQGAAFTAMRTDGKISYYKQLGREKGVKATTTPFYDTKFGLVAILCTNIDISAVDHLKMNGGAEHFFSQYTRISGDTPNFEM